MTRQPTRITPVALLLLATVASANVTVGAYYYPWYGSSPGGHSFIGLRERLVPAQAPSQGAYDSLDADAIARHIDQSHLGNIQFWAISWWGPDTIMDIAFRDHILTHPRAGELRYAVFYECWGRLGTTSQTDFTNLLPDFQYFAETYFPNPNYLRVDDKPVVFIFQAHGFFDTPNGESGQVLEDVRSELHNGYGIDVYLVADDIGSGGPNLDRARQWDAITPYFPQGLLGNATPLGVPQWAVDNNQAIYDQAIAIAGQAGCAFVPSVTPGFNNQGWTWPDELTPVLPRYMETTGEPVEASLFRTLLADVAVPRVDAQADNMLLVTTFNEWHEDTQIEPTNFAAPTADDISGTQEITEGYAYAGYGSLYLDVLRRATTSQPPTPITVGGMGDSLTDEVGIDNPSVAGLRGWLEILVAAGRADCGPIGYEFPHSDPRRGGGPDHASYTYNFAKGGTAAMTTLPYYYGFLAAGTPDYLRPGYVIGDPDSGSGKHSEVGSPTYPGEWGGFRAEAVAGHIEYGALTIGGIDFLNAINYAIPFNARATPDATSLAVLDSMAASVSEGLDVVTGGAGNNVKMVLGNLFDLGGTPYTASLPANERANIRAHVIEWNNRIAAIAAARNLPVLSWWDWWEDAANNGVTVCGTVIDVHGTSPFSAADLTILDSLTFEGVHPTPIGHALVANRFLDAVRTHYGADVDLLSDREMLIVSGLNPTPPPVQDSDCDGDVDLTDYGEFLRCYNGPARPPADVGCEAMDFDGDGDVDLADYGAFLDCYNGPNKPPAC
jgi:glycoprotein endo-alpha-1,2-mannosidase